MTHDEIMTLAETAQYLKVAEKTIHRMINKGEIPCAKVASQWRFSRSLLDDWLLSKMQVLPQNDLGRLMQEEGDVVPLSRLLRPEQIIMPLKGTTCPEILQELMAIPLQKGVIHEPKNYLEKLLSREEMVSTALGNGIAIPHIRRVEENPAGPPLIIMGCHREGVDYRSLDGKPTQFFFLVITNSEVLHVRLLAKISQLFRSGHLQESLCRAESPQDIMEQLIGEEQRLRLSRP